MTFYNLQVLLFVECYERMVTTAGSWWRIARDLHDIRADFLPDIQRHL